MSAVVSVLSALFPEGEDFFVRSVRSYRDEVTDLELKRQVTGFIGQEAMHGREHRRFNERLASLGYPTRAIERTLRCGFKASERLPGRSRRLAVTAALEHYTATLAEVLLTDPRAQAAFDTDEVRNLFLWHALEESEHKAVAFDVFGAVCGDHRMRRWVMNATTLGFFAVVIFWTGVSLLLDGATWRHPIRVFRSLIDLRRSPWVSGAIWRRLRNYNRKGFHPDDWDTTELTAKWREALFGPRGSLAARAATASATA
jgi:predicted metal-dependent hydrolase